MRDVSAWLVDLGLARYVHLFADNHIGMDVVAFLTEDHLKELGICVGDRLRLLQAIKAELARRPGPRSLLENRRKRDRR
jgi:hypothetical protein